MKLFPVLSKEQVLVAELSLLCYFESLERGQLCENQRYSLEVTLLAGIILSSDRNEQGIFTCLKALLNREEEYLSPEAKAFLIQHTYWLTKLPKNDINSAVHVVQNIQDVLKDKAIPTILITKWKNAKWRSSQIS